MPAGSRRVWVSCTEAHFVRHLTAGTGYGETECRRQALHLLEGEMHSKPLLFALEVQLRLSSHALASAAGRQEQLLCKRCNATMVMVTKEGRGYGPHADQVARSGTKRGAFTDPPKPWAWP